MTTFAYDVVLLMNSLVIVHIALARTSNAINNVQKCMLRKLKNPPSSPFSKGGDSPLLLRSS
jgi:hypothetical protein